MQTSTYFQNPILLKGKQKQVTFFLLGCNNEADLTEALGRARAAQTIGSASWPKCRYAFYLDRRELSLSQEIHNCGNQ